MKRYVLTSATVCFMLALCIGGPRTAFTAVQGLGGDEESVFGRQTMAAVELARDYRRVADNGRREILARIAEHLRERGLLLATMLEKVPSATQRLLLPGRMRDVLPADVRNEIEQHADLEGTLLVMFEEYGGRHLLRHYLISDVKRLALRIAATSSSLMSARVRVYGIVSGNVAGSSAKTAMVVDSGPSWLELLTADGTTTTRTTGTSVVIPPDTIGER